MPFDIAAPLLLMGGLAASAPESVSLLNNFEIVATALFARVLFGEQSGAKGNITKCIFPVKQAHKHSGA